MNYLKKTDSKIFLAVGLLFIPHFLFVFINKAIWPWDPAWYASETFKATHALNNGIFGYIHFLTAQFGIKAPMISWFSQIWAPIAWIMDKPEVILINSVFFSFLSVFFLLKSIPDKSPRLQFTTATVLCSSSLFFAMNREFFVEPMQAAVVSFFIWLCYNRKYFNFWNLFLASLFGAAFGLSIKISTPLYIFSWCIPIAIELYVKIKNGATKYKFCYWHILGSLISIIIFIWYFKNFAIILDFLKTTSSGPVALHYGHQASFLSKLTFWFKHFLQEFFGGRYINFYIYGIPVLLLLFFKKLKNTYSFYALLQIIVPFIIFSFQINEEMRYLLPTFPSFAILICYLIQNSKIAQWIFLFVNLLKFGELNLVSQHVIPNVVETGWISYYQNDMTAIQHISKTVDLVCSSQRPIATIGVESPKFNNLAFTYYASFNTSWQDRKCIFHSIGYAEDNAGLAIERLRKINPGFFITLKKEALNLLDASPEPFNKVSLEVATDIQASESWTEVASDNSEWRIFKNKEIQ